MEEHVRLNVMSTVLWCCGLGETSIILTGWYLVLLYMWDIESPQQAFQCSVYGHWKSTVYMWGQPLVFVDLSLEDGSDLNLNQISFLTLTVAHSSSLSTPLTHINTHIFACTHPSCCTPTQRKYVGNKSKLYPVWVFSWCLWQLNRQGNNCIFSHIKLMAVV